jgi:hypothetical protein
MKTGYIYGLTSSRDGIIKYIGATKRDLKIRTYAHIYEGKKRSSIKCEWIRNEMLEGYKIESIELDIVPVNDLLIKEVEYIKLFKSFGAKLVNSNDGGVGKNPIKSLVEKISSFRRGKPLPEIHYKNLCKAKSRNKKEFYIKDHKIKPDGKRGHTFPTKSVVQLDFNGDLIKIWPSINSVCQELGLDSGSIVKCCNPNNTYKKPQFSCGGFKWKYFV